MQKVWQVAPKIFGSSFPVPDHGIKVPRPAQTFYRLAPGDIIIAVLTVALVFLLGCAFEAMAAWTDQTTSPKAAKSLSCLPCSQWGMSMVLTLGALGAGLPWHTFEFRNSTGTSRLLYKLI